MDVVYRAMKRWLPSLAWGALLVAACSDADPPAPPPEEKTIGSSGAYDTYLRCAPHSGGLCEGQLHPHYFQCDAEPGEPCEPAPGQSPDPSQTVWCCDFPCSRGDPAQDGTCPDERLIYYCVAEAPDAASFGCVPGEAPFQICC